ncbi:hypothetical protein OZX61_09205 [Acinetobacter sp. ESL0695]|uniref:hypothetical protein n=1 Tax=Acinetobacter sp. ESL0695 TaxID=2983215 RepID=UPI0023F14A0A|nr:hypothetical protein [Acinetobacter sp. ESL0695]WEV48445.1 hypothetical protein OZX61_09205 [Acinetobacter sp. ESL0695]
MISDVFSLLESLGFGYQTRAIHAQFSSLLLSPQLFIQRIDGHHEVNKGLSCELILIDLTLDKKT